MNVLSLKLDQSARGIGFSAATIAMFSFLVLWVPNLNHAEGHVTGATYLAVGLVLSGAILLATLSRRLVPLTLATLFTTVGPWGPERWFQILYLLATVWLVVKLVLAVRAQRMEDLG
ncbi:MAG: hypothetical protein ACREOA_07395 [Candidatus Dormibacteria bacterium]